MDLTLRCASDSYNFELQSSCNHSNGAVAGTWSELTRQVGGSIEGSARGNHINVRVSGIISALLAFSIIIAVLGISITLALSVFERTREIGLLRAVGMNRRQTRKAVRWEAVIVSLFGALVGIVLGWLAFAALRDRQWVRETLRAGGET